MTRRADESTGSQQPQVKPLGGASFRYCQDVGFEMQRGGAETLQRRDRQHAPLIGPPIVFLDWPL
jgi:hypothetical protein